VKIKHCVWIRRTALGLLSVFAVAAPAALAQDGAALYRQRCQSCHGAKGEGRANQKGTNLLTDEAKAKSDADMVTIIMTGNGKTSHAFERRGVTEDQAKALVTHVRSLQGK
jgi:mono/diheme cytochrome c family protein